MEKFKLDLTKITNDYEKTILDVLPLDNFDGRKLNIEDKIKRLEKNIEAYENAKSNSIGIDPKEWEELAKNMDEKIANAISEKNEAQKELKKFEKFEKLYDNTEKAAKEELNKVKEDILKKQDEKRKEIDKLEKRREKFGVKINDTIQYTSEERIVVSSINDDIERLNEEQLKLDKQINENDSILKRFLVGLRKYLKEQKFEDLIKKSEEENKIEDNISKSTELNKNKMDKKDLEKLASTDSTKKDSDKNDSMKKEQPKVEKQIDTLDDLYNKYFGKNEIEPEREEETEPEITKPEPEKEEETEPETTKPEPEKEEETEPEIAKPEPEKEEETEPETTKTEPEREEETEPEITKPMSDKDLIMNDPNLTEEEKEAMIATLEQEKDKTKSEKDLKDVPSKSSDSTNDKPTNSEILDNFKNVAKEGDDIKEIKIGAFNIIEDKKEKVLALKCTRKNEKEDKPIDITDKYGMFEHNFLIKRLREIYPEKNIEYTRKEDGTLSYGDNTEFVNQFIKADLNIVNALKDNKEQLQCYLDMLNGKEINKDNALNIEYNLRGLSKINMTDETRKALENMAYEHRHIAKIKKTPLQAIKFAFKGLKEKIVSIGKTKALSSGIETAPLKAEIKEETMREKYAVMFEKGKTPEEVAKMNLETEEKIKKATELAKSFAKSSDDEFKKMTEGYNKTESSIDKGDK